MQDVSHAFEVLVNDGFLHGQGILTLEAVQMFYEIILVKPKRATLVEEEFIQYCLNPRKEPENQPVVTLMIKHLSQEYYHTVTLKKSFLSYNSLKATFIDSRSGIGQIEMFLPVSKTLEPTLKYNNFITKNPKIKEQWCLGDEMCYYIMFN